MSDPAFDTDPDFMFLDPPRRPDAVSVLSRIGKTLLVFAAVAALILAGAALHRLGGVIGDVKTLGHETHTEATHTRRLQKEAEPASACFREAMAAGLPVIVKFADALKTKVLPQTPPAQRPLVEAFVGLTRDVEAPLSKYVELTKAHPVGAVCPDALNSSHGHRSRAH